MANLCGFLSASSLLPNVLALFGNNPTEWKYAIPFSVPFIFAGIFNIVLAFILLARGEPWGSTHTTKTNNIQTNQKF